MQKAIQQACSYHPGVCSQCGKHPTAYPSRTNPTQTVYQDLSVYLSSLAIDDKARGNTPPRLAFKHAGATVNVVAKVDASHGYGVDHQAASRCLKCIHVMEGEEGSGLKDGMRLAACIQNENVAVDAYSIEREAANWLDTLLSQPW